MIKVAPTINPGEEDLKYYIHKEEMRMKNKNEKIKFGDFLKCVDLYTPLSIELMGYRFEDVDSAVNGIIYKTRPSVLSSIDYITKRNIFINYCSVNDEDTREVNKLLPDNILDYIVYNIRPFPLYISGCEDYEQRPSAIEVQLMKEEDAK